MITDSIRKFAHTYPQVKSNSFLYNDETRLITETVPGLLLEALNLSSEEYKTKGSVGNGRWVEIPWISIMHRGVTTSTQNGYYTVILLSKNLDRAYISTGLGWTQFAERYGSKQGRVMVELYAKKLVEYLTPGPDDIIGKINLDATSSLGKGYELSNIISTEVLVESLDDDLLMRILRRHLVYYEEIRNAFGADLFFGDELVELPDVDAEKVAKQKVIALSTSLDKAKALNELQSIADMLPPTKRKMYVSQIVRNKAFADFVKQRAHYVCEICGRKPFMKKNDKPYAEADHVDPLYSAGVDHPDNMRCLCALCHRVVTYGSDDEIFRLSKSL